MIINKNQQIAAAVGLAIGLFIAYKKKVDCTMCYVGYALSGGVIAAVAASALPTKTEAKTSADGTYYRTTDLYGYNNRMGIPNSENYIQVIKEN